MPLVSLVTAIAEKLGIEGSRDPSRNELKKDVSPGPVLDNIDDLSRKSAKCPLLPLRNRRRAGPANRRLRRNQTLQAIDQL